MGDEFCTYIVTLVNAVLVLHPSLECVQGLWYRRSKLFFLEVSARENNMKCVSVTLYPP